MPKQLIKDSYIPGDDVRSRSVSGRVSGESGVQFTNLSLLKRQADEARKTANYLSSPKGLAAETIKDLPRAAAKVFAAKKTKSR